MNKLKEKLIVLLVSLFMFSLCLYAFLKSEDEYSYSERRYLAKFPVFSIESLLNGDFMEDFETYIQDQFPLRDEFRTLKANSAYHIFQKIENNDIYVKDRYVSKLEYPCHDNMVDYACKLFNSIKEQYMSENNQLYISIVPDKNYYLNQDSMILSMDYDHMFKRIKSQLSDMTYIDLTQNLALEDYYYTDTHWRQENLIDVSRHILKAMGHDMTYSYDKMLGTDQFDGVYLGQSALNIDSDKLYYLYNDYMKDYVVTSYSQGEAKEIDLYNHDKLDSKDAYEFYLNGSESLLTIENKNATSNKELVIFRDSFGSSISPLLCEAYKKVTIVDLRYMNSSLVSQYVEFDNQDVLFLYSTLVINSSTSLK